MRYVTAGEQTVLGGHEYEIHTRVEVQNGSGTWKDLTTLGGYNWFEDATLRVGVDEPIWGGTFRFRRDRIDGNSLAPLDETSPLNVDDTASYSPLLEVSRGIRCYVATVAPGASVAAGDYKLLFDGEIDTVDSGKPTVEVTARSLLGRALIDNLVRDETTYGSTTGIAIETVKQQILDDWLPSTVILDVPSSPGFAIAPEYIQDPMTIQEAFYALDGLIGYVTREKWDDGTGAFVLSFEEPDRTPVGTDWVFGQDDYFDVERLAVDIDRVRNVIRVKYTDSGGTEQSVTLTDTDSVTRYNGERFMSIDLPADSPINTNGEATTLATAALSDLKDPIADLRIPCRFFWPAELGDYYGFSSNDPRWTTQQDLAVVSIEHVIGNAWAQTNLEVRGTPCGLYTQWLKLAKVKQLDTWLVYVEEQPEQVGSYGILTLNVTDPAGKVTRVLFNSHSGGGDFDFSNPDDSFWTQTSPPYTFSVPLDPKHESRIAYAVEWLTPDGTYEFITGQHTFDFDTVPRLACGLHLRGSDLYLSWLGDEDLASIRYVTSLSGPPTAGDVAAGSFVDGQSSDGELIAYGIQLGETQYVRVRGYNAVSGAGTESTADWEEAVRRSSNQLVPTVRVITHQPYGSSIGTLTLEIIDPESRVVETAFKTISGRQYTQWDFTDPTDGSWNRDTVFPFNLTDDVALSPKHVSAIGWAVGYLDETDTQQYIQAVAIFDLDLIAEITGNCSIDPSGYVEFTYEGDEDTGSVRYDVATSYPFPDAATVEASGTLISGQSGDEVTSTLLAEGEQGFITVVPFDDSSGVGNAGPPLYMKTIAATADSAGNWARIINAYWYKIDFETVGIKLDLEVGGGCYDVGIQHEDPATGGLTPIPPPGQIEVISGTGIRTQTVTVKVATGGAAEEWTIGDTAAVAVLVVSRDSLGGVGSSKSVTFPTVGDEPIGNARQKNQAGTTIFKSEVAAKSGGGLDIDATSGEWVVKPANFVQVGGAAPSWTSADEGKIWVDPV